ncbi:MAG: Sua5/YciO/YrdC/YwlC family protein [Zetaproteobacteria bacterium]|nr:Sua5/YciO/YrdC/YwlC family protein [Zetaproteobacteria bacterium]
MEQSLLQADHAEIVRHIESWQQGKVCLHQSDTLPGLSFSPTHLQGILRLTALKGRDPNKPCLSLVSRIDMAVQWWEPLSTQALAKIEEIWPSATSIICKANSEAPPSLVSAQGEIGFRFPAHWPDPQLKQIIDQLGQPYPSTSVNKSGEPAITDFNQAKAFITTQADTYVPANVNIQGTPATQPSKIIRLSPDGTIEVLRP